MESDGGTSNCRATMADQRGKVLDAGNTGHKTEAGLDTSSGPFEDKW
jgi:N-acetylglucosamine kinase-like BadF-type ATPase